MGSFVQPLGPGTKPPKRSSWTPTAAITASLRSSSRSSGRRSCSGGELLLPVLLLMPRREAEWCRPRNLSGCSCGLSDPGGIGWGGLPLTRAPLPDAKDTHQEQKDIPQDNLHRLSANGRLSDRDSRVHSLRSCSSRVRDEIHEPTTCYPGLDGAVPCGPGMTALRVRAVAPTCRRFWSPEAAHPDPRSSATFGRVADLCTSAAAAAAQCVLEAAPNPSTGRKQQQATAAILTRRLGKEAEEETTADCIRTTSRTVDVGPDCLPPVKRP